MGDSFERSFKVLSDRLQSAKPISSIHQYQESIGYLVKKWEQRELWFRGVSDMTFELVPGIYRQNVWKYDSDSADDLSNSFIHRAKSLLPLSSSLSKWEWYQLMQHYGIPTRLLDWTEGSLIALFFALRGSSIKPNPSVWVIDPYDLNRISASKDSLFYTDKITRVSEDEIVDAYLNDGGLSKRYPIAIIPPFVDIRMSAQKSCFTVHGKLKDGFSKAFQRNRNFRLVQFVFDGSHAIDLKNELNLSGITEGTLFPDLEGLARELKEWFI